MKRIPKVDALVEEIKKYAHDSTKLNYQETDNSVIITLDISGEDIYQPFSSKALLKDEIFEFIDDTYKLVEDKNKPLIIHIIYNENTDQIERDDIVELIKFHYALETREARLARKRTTRSGFLLLGVGVAILLAYILLGKLFVDSAYIEIIEVFAWVSLWESVDALNFRRNKEKAAQIKYMRIFNAKFE